MSNTESTPRNRKRTSRPPAPSPPRNLYSSETLTNWRNASTWYAPSMSVIQRQHAPRQTHGYTKGQLTAWLDAQERVVREPGVPNELVAEFDPLYNLQLQQQLHQVYDRGERAIEQGRRTILFRFRSNLENSIADAIQRKLVEHVKTRFKLKLSSAVELRNIADGKTISYYQTIEN